MILTKNNNIQCLKKFANIKKYFLFFSLFLKKILGFYWICFNLHVNIVIHCILYLHITKTTLPKTIHEP